MFLVDTCGWIEWMIDSPLARSYARYLNSPDTLIVPTLVQHELYKWLYREMDQAIALASIAATQTANVVVLDTSLALLSAEVAREFKLATADAIIYATARQHNATLVTSDAHFTGLPHVKVVRK
ncbi:MAG: type II toxin-antitoxin system VapC family toxin [Gammaproteobacteria bacterium]|jgi:predicted nucleic acid-binding protein|nr:type II toxin-antitoxin system VapC family toxin [Gammaproteobacteria bacterium]